MPYNIVLHLCVYKTTDVKLCYTFFFLVSYLLKFLCVTDEGFDHCASEPFPHKPCCFIVQFCLGW